MFTAVWPGGSRAVFVDCGDGTLEKTLLISLGAVLGANARYWIGDLAARVFSLNRRAVLSPTCLTD